MKKTIKITGILVANTKIVSIGDKVYAPIILKVVASETNQFLGQTVEFCHVHTQVFNPHSAAQFLKSRLYYIAMSEKGEMVSVVVPLDEKGNPQPQIMDFKNHTLGIGNDI